MNEPVLRAFTLLLFTLPTAVGAEKRIVPIDPATRQLFEQQSKVALVIGIGAYPEEGGFSYLKYPARDATDLAAELTRQGYKVRILVDSQASRAEILGALKQIASPIEPNQGTLIVYFAGHGVTSNGVNRLVTYGATEDQLARDSLSLPELEQSVRNTRAKRKMIWVDACRNAPRSSNRGTFRPTFAQLAAAEGIRMFYSTRPGAFSIEDDNLGHGVFTAYLLQGLKGRAAGPDGLVTFQDLTFFVTASMAEYSKKTGRSQTPYESGESSGDFLVGTAPGVAIPSVNLSDPNPGAPPLGPFPPGSSHVNPADELPYIFVPAGTYSMGCDTPNCFQWELPKHTVKLTKAFWLGQTEVTQAAYQRVIGSNPSSAKGPNRPVNNVTWDDAQNYCNATGGRLPTEAEWEYAARANGKPQDYNPHYQFGDLAHDVGQNGTANGWNLFDMMGNVWEWTADRYAEKTSSAAAADPTGPPEGQDHVIRGASFNTPEGYVRLGIRSHLAISQKDSQTGFRCLWNSAPTTGALPASGPAVDKTAASRNDTTPAPAVLQVINEVPTRRGVENLLANMPYKLLTEDLPTTVSKAGIRLRPGDTAKSVLSAACARGTESCLQMINASVSGAAASVRSDRTGGATFPPVPPGIYYIMIYGSDREHGQVFWNLKVDLKPGANSVTVSLDNGMRIN